VFTARYGLSPYITQIRFVLRGLRVVKIPTLPLVLCCLVYLWAIEYCS